LFNHQPLQNPILGSPTNLEMIAIYNQTCIKRSPLGQRKGGLIRQVTF